MTILDVRTVALTVLGHPVSWLELVGTVAYLWSVWLMARQRMLTWPVGIVSVLLYMILFWQVRLYSDAAEQVYYLGASLYGWRRWARGLRQGGSAALVRLSPPTTLAFEAGLVAAGTLGLGAFMARAHLLAPAVFPAPAAYPYLDALTTVASLLAMALLALKRLESWVWWLGVDVVGIGLYWWKDVRFVALLYVLLLALAAKGLADWGSEWAAGRRGEPRVDPSVSPA
jgi:nicotinamide mononucleotide transporter